MFSSEQWKKLQSVIDKAKTCLRLAWERGFEETVLARFKVLTPLTVHLSYMNEVIADLMGYTLKC